jgi:tRNA-dihydrouridine synthase A
MRHVDGVMLGRAAYHDPLLLAKVDEEFFGAPAKPFDLKAVLEAMSAYAETQLGQGVRLNAVTRHMLGLANGMRGARTFRQILSVEACKRGAGPEVIAAAWNAVDPAQSVSSSELALTA